MIRFLPVILFIFIGISCSEKNEHIRSNEFIFFNNDSLIIYTANPDSFLLLDSSAHYTHFWWGNLKPVPDSLISQTKVIEKLTVEISKEMMWKIPNKKININWYPSPELKIMKSENSEFNSESEDETYHVLNPELPFPSFAPEIQLIFEERTNQIKNKKLKKAFVEFISQVNKKEPILPSLFKLEKVPDLTEIINPNTNWKNEKYLSESALKNLFSSFQNKINLFETLILVSEKGENISSGMKTLWGQKKISESGKIKPEREKIAIKGFNFTHEGYRIYNGYLSESAKKSLLKLKEIHSNSISIVPFGFMSSESDPTIFWANQTGSENDESIIYCGLNAKKIGLKVMLKPQLWLRHGKWCGEIEMENEDDWSKYENEYRLWIIHYAAIAQQYKFEFLSLGVELLKFTKLRPEYFRSLVSDIRKIYDGQITYSANWYDEADNIQFWNELDFIGINSYYPLSKKENADVSELKSEAENLAQHFSSLSKKWNRKIVFTEIGFAKNISPWVMPHEEKNNSIFSEIEQANCYKIISDEWLNQDWCGGFLWWKWSSYYDMMTEERINFFPGSSAKMVVSESFSK